MWIKEVCGLTFKELKDELKDYNYDEDYELLFDVKDDKVFDLPPLPGECVNLTDELQLSYFKNYPIIDLALQVCNDRRLFTALNAPKTYYVCLKDKYHQNRLVIPFYNERGNIISYISRGIMNNDSRAKYLMKFGKDKPIFNLDKVDEDYPYIFVFEGQIDAMFVKNGVAIAGTHLSNSQEDELMRKFPFHNIIWVLDNYALEDEDVRKVIRDKMKANESVFLYENDFSKFKDLNEFCVEKKQDFVDPALILNSCYSGEKGLIRLC
jgi:hypothetical protein